MNKTKTPQQKSPEPRVHRMLFDRNLPFRGRKEQSTMLYQRNTKHRAKIMHELAS
jgi:hypothetical protein